MSRVRSIVENYGNWRMMSSSLKNGNGQRYSMKRVVLANPLVDVNQVENALA
jgi:hypothetical protein